jgi:hypothetical protein
MTTTLSNRGYVGCWRDRGGEAPAAQDPPPARGSLLLIDLLVVIALVGRGQLPVQRAQHDGVVLLAAPVLVWPTPLMRCLSHSGILDVRR